MTDINILSAPKALKPPVDPSVFAYKDLLGGDFWRRIPEYADVDAETFLNYRWQTKKDNSPRRQAPGRNRRYRPCWLYPRL
jgi:hypothetical protein